MTKGKISFRNVEVELREVFGSTRVIGEDFNIWFGGISPAEEKLALKVLLHNLCINNKNAENLNTLNWK